MASWMVHLRLAEKLLENIEGLDAEQFGIGNVAPDSGIPNKDWTEFNPPKFITHFEDQDAKDISPKYFRRDLDFYRQYLNSAPYLEKNPQQFSFLLGYFFHLIVDNLWSEKIWHPTKEKWLDQFKSNQALGPRLSLYM